MMHTIVRMRRGRNGMVRLGMMTMERMKIAIN
jgi:hypothetical protein